MKAGLVQRIVEPPAAPETAAWAVPVQPLQVRVMLEVIDVGATVPEIVPVQTPVLIAQVPLKEPLTCVSDSWTA